MKQFSLILGCFLLLLKSEAQQQSGKYIGPEKGSLVIVGGGLVGREIYEKFVDLAGGVSANIIVIPTAGEDSALSGARTSADLKKYGVKNVTVLHTRDAKQANQEQFVAPIKKATGIWFDGGRQWRIADAYLNTLSHREFQALLNRGGVIAGTSAGATILGSFLLRGDTKGNTTLVGDHLQGLDFMHQVAIDQHILRRNRQFDLIEVIKSHPDLLGIGIDESTAIVVHQDSLRVIGTSYIAIYDNDRITSEKKDSSGNQGNGPFFFLGRGQQYDLKSRKIIRQPVTRSLAESGTRQENF